MTAWVFQRVPEPTLHHVQALSSIKKKKNDFERLDKLHVLILIPIVTFIRFYFPDSLTILFLSMITTLPKDNLCLSSNFPWQHYTCLLIILL